MSTDPPDDYEDVNDAAVTEWKAETKARERVRAVVMRTRDPSGVTAIADRAKVSKPAARTELEELTELGLVEKQPTADGAVYKRDDDLYIYRQVQKLRDEYTDDELTEQLQDLKATVNEIRARYGVESASELAQQLEPTDEEGWDAHRTLKTAQKNLYLAKVALSFSDASKILA